jgi:hypothetical protein
VLLYQSVQITQPRGTGCLKRPVWQPDGTEESGLKLSGVGVGLRAIPKQLKSRGIDPIPTLNSIDGPQTTHEPRDTRSAGIAGVKITNHDDGIMLQ